MNATVLFAELLRQGVRLSAHGGRLRAEAPAGVITPQIKATLTARKAEFLRLLGDESLETVSWRLSPEGPGWAVVRSHVLGEDVVFMRDEGVPLPPKAAGLVSYTREELEILAGASEGTLRELHCSKRILGGRIASLSSVGEYVVRGLTA